MASDIIQVTETQGKNGPIVQLGCEDIPTDIFIPCPAKQFRGPRSVANICTKCKYFKGFEDVSPLAQEFDKRYFVVCAFPMQRRVQKIVLELD